MLRDLIGISSKPTFILNFNWDACQDCVDQEVELIQQELVGVCNVVVLISFNTLNEYLSYVQSNQIPYIANSSLPELSRKYYKIIAEKSSTL